MTNFVKYCVREVKKKKIILILFFAHNLKTQKKRKKKRKKKTILTPRFGPILNVIDIYM